MQEIRQCFDRLRRDYGGDELVLSAETERDDEN